MWGTVAPRRYGDLAAGSGLMMLDSSGCRGGFSAKPWRAGRGERAVRTLHDEIGDTIVGQSGGATRAWALPAASRQE